MGGGEESVIPGYGMGPGPGSGVCEGSDGEGGTGGREGYCFPVRRNRRSVRGHFRGAGCRESQTGVVRVFPGWVSESGLGVFTPLRV